MARSAADLGNITRGPAIIRFKGQCYFSRDGITLRHVPEITTETADCGNDTKSVDDLYAELSFTPESIFDDAALAVLFEIFTLSPGESCASLSGELEIFTKSGFKITYHCAWISTAPSLDFASGSQPFGQVTLKAVRKPGEAWSVADSLFTCEQVAWDPSLLAKRDTSKIYKQCYLACWGTEAPWSEFKSLEGFSLSIDVDKEECRTDCDGLVDEIFQGATIQLSTNVVGIDLKEALNAMPVQGAGVIKGYTPSGPDLVLKGENGVAFIKIFGAAVVDSTPGLFGKSLKGGGEITWQACASNYPLAYIGSTDPG